MMQSDRCDLTIPRVESIRHVLPLTTMDTSETMWMNWLLTVPGMSTSPCASTEKCELRVSDTERTHSEVVYSSATVPSSFTSFAQSRSKLPPNLMVDCDILNSLTLKWIIFFALRTEFCRSARSLTPTCRIEMTGDSITSPLSSRSANNRPFRTLTPREKGTTIVPVRSVSGLVNMTAVRWTVREVSIPVGTKTGVPAVDLWSRLSMERKVCWSSPSESYRRLVLQHRKVRDGSRTADKAADAAVGGAAVGDDVIEALALQLLVAQEDATATTAAVSQRAGGQRRMVVVGSEHGVAHAADGGDDRVL